MKTKGAFTLLELLIVIIIIGVLASISMPLYTRTKERAFDEEAKANLKLMQAAEKIYHMETDSYYGSSSIPEINANLKLSLPSADNRNWNYSCFDDEGCVQARRKGYDNREWKLEIYEEEPGEGSCPTSP